MLLELKDDPSTSCVVVLITSALGCIGHLAALPFLTTVGLLKSM